MIALLLLLVQDGLVDDVRAYLQNPTKSAEKRIGEHSIPEIERAIRDSRTYRKMDTGVQDRRAENPWNKKEKTNYRIFVPEHDVEKRYPLLITLHGSGGNARGQMGLWLKDIQAEGGIFLAAIDAGLGGWGRSMPGFGNIKGVIDDIIETYPIDINRVFIDGASMGGNGSFQFPTYFPDYFAGAMPRAGGPEFMRASDKKTVIPRFCENLKNIPYYWVVGKNDPKVPIEWVRTAKDKLDSIKMDLTYVEKNGGHEWFGEENTKVLAWMKEKRRALYPETMQYHTYERKFEGAGWIRITKFKRNATEKWKRWYVDAQNKKIEERLHFLKTIKVKASYDREKNRIDLHTEYVQGLRLYLSDAMLDLDEEISVYHKGRRIAKKKVKRSVKVLLESAQKDRERLFSAFLDVKIK